MVAALLLLLPTFGVMLWVFFRFLPPHADRRALLRFNILSLIVALVLAGAWVVRTYRVMSPTVDSPWWPVISVLGVLVMVPVVLILAALLRNLVVFRSAGEVSDK